MLRRQMLAMTMAATVTVPVRATTAWNMATGYSDELFHGRNLREFVADVTRLTDGQININLHPNGSLVKLPKILSALREGQLQVGEVFLPDLAKDASSAGADGVPFIVRNYADAARLWKCQRPVLERQMSELGQRLLFAVPWPPQCLLTKLPVNSPQDFSGMRMRARDAAAGDLAKRLGATPVAVQASELATALAEDRINAMITSAVTGVESQAWKHLKYFYEINAQFPKNAVLVSQSSWVKLTPVHQAGFLRAAREAEVRGWRMSERAAMESIGSLSNHGMTISPPSASLAASLRRLGEKFSIEWVRQVGPTASEIFVPYYAKS